VGPTYQTPLSTPGPPGSAPLPHGCHVPRRSSALSTLSGPRTGVPTAPVPTGCLKITAALPTPPRLARSKANHHCSAASPIASTPTVSGAEPPLTVFCLWSVEHTSPSLLSVTGPSPATVAPPCRKNAAVEPVFSPSPSTRSSGQLSPTPPCPAGSLTIVGARPPPFAPPPPLWHRRWPRHDTRPSAVTGPACATQRRAIAGHAGRGWPSKRRPHATHPGRAPRGRGPRTRCARGPSRHRERGPCVHCASRPSVVSA
jgi:hypothetical protein